MSSSTTSATSNVRGSMKQNSMHPIHHATNSKRSSSSSSSSSMSPQHNSTTMVVNGKTQTTHSSSKKPLPRDSQQPQENPSRCSLPSEISTKDLKESSGGSTSTVPNLHPLLPTSFSLVPTQPSSISEMTIPTTIRSPSIPLPPPPLGASTPRVETSSSGIVENSPKLSKHLPSFSPSLQNHTCSVASPRPNTTSNASTTTSSPLSSYKPPLKKDDLIWVEIKDKYYLAKVSGMIKNVQVMYNERGLSRNDFTKNDQVDLTKCFHVDLVSLNGLERENLLWICPGCHSLPQVTHTWLSVVNKSYEDQKRSSQVFTMHMGERNILLKNPDFSFLNKTQASAIKRNGQDLVDYIQTQLRLNTTRHLNLILLGEGSKEKQVTLQQVVMSLLHKNLLPYLSANEKSSISNQSSQMFQNQSDYVKEIRVTIGSALNFLLIFSNNLYEKALTQTHMRQVVLSCDSQTNRVCGLRIHSIARERMLSTISSHVSGSSLSKRNLPLYQIFLLMISGGEDEEHHVVGDMNHYKLFQKHKVNYKDLNFMKMDLGKLNSYFSKFGISTQEADLVYRILSACMWLYNLEFNSTSTTNLESGTAVASSENSQTLQVVSELLGISRQECESIFTCSNQVNLVFDYLYGAVLHFIESRINSKIHTLITSWRFNSHCFSNDTSNCKEICVYDLPAATENKNLSDQFVDLFNKIANETNMLNELTLIEKLLQKDQLPNVKDILSSFSSSILESLDENELIRDMNPLSEDNIHKLCEEISTSQSLNQLFHEENKNDYDRYLGQNYMTRVVNNFMNSLLSPNTETKSFFIHCMTFSMEKKTSNALLNDCISSIRTTGFNNLLNLYSGYDKYNFKMTLEDFSQFEKYFSLLTGTEDKTSTTVIKGKEFVYFQDSCLLRTLENMKSFEEEKIMLLASLHFVTDEFHDLFENKRVKMENIFSSETNHDDQSNNNILEEEEEDDHDFTSPSVPLPPKDLLFADPRHLTENILEQDTIMMMDMKSNHHPSEGWALFNIPEQELPYHSACLGLTAFSSQYFSPNSCEEGKFKSQHNTSMTSIATSSHSSKNQHSTSGGSSLQQLLQQRRLSLNSSISSSIGIRSSPMKALQCVHKCRSDEGVTSFSFDSIASLDFRDSTKMEMASNSPSSTMKKNSSRRMQECVILDHGRALKQLKPNFNVFSGIKEIQTSHHTKLMFESLSEQLEEYDNSYVLDVRPKQLASFITFVADYWYTFMQDEKNTLSFMNMNNKEQDHQHGENFENVHEVLMCLMECIKLLNFVMTFSRQRTEVVKSIRSEGLLIMLCESAIRCHAKLEHLNQTESTQELKSPEFLLFQQLVVLAILNCVKHDKMTCGFLVQENLFWSLFSCLYTLNSEWNEEKNPLSHTTTDAMFGSTILTEDVRKVSHQLCKFYMEILSILISDPHSYQFLNVQVKETFSNGTLQNVKSKLVRSFSGISEQITPLINAQFYKDTAQQILSIIQRHDLKNEQVRVFVNFIQQIIPLFSFNSNLVFALIQEWISQMECRSIHFVCQCLRSLGKIHEKLRQEQGTTSKILGFVFSNRDGVMGQILDKTNLFEILTLRMLQVHEHSQLEEEEGVTMEEFTQRNHESRNTSHSRHGAPLESIIYALLYLCVLYPNVRTKFVEYVFQTSSKENQQPHEKSNGNYMGNKNIRRVALEQSDLSKENIERCLSKLDSAPEEFSQFSQQLAQQLLSHESSRKVHNQASSMKRNNVSKQVSFNDSAEWSKRSLWSVHSLLNDPQSLTASY
ncbi:hypothetical protein C9374_000289 [Naegleria lovaniensis]|uniref:Uncharacterized protein n=1 Tax=Naegleria lovaniensis TaxID=51637 RepID=A0AA88GTZ6_NAELO|nr:uncharacterized protein C9374_000289 [Naegleria lovaniensis]KAG2388850.1 hypothetical protein C9374_000289 [Naegleria lovaniensis]